jgi:peptide deformylase
MALRKIVEQGDECLERVCRPVTEFNGHLHILLDDLAETLRDANGAGLAAPQVGVLRRVCVVLDENTDEIIELINPKIVASSGQQTGLEGCLSIPGKYGIVTRPDHVRVQAQDRSGDPFEVEGEGLTARAFCHEIEHLDGHLFVEHTDHLLTDEELQKYLEDEEREEARRQQETESEEKA